MDPPWTAVRIHKSARNAISLPPRKRQAPEVPTLVISETSSANDSQEIEPLAPRSPIMQVVDNLFFEERRKSTPPPPLPHSPPPPNDQEESKKRFRLILWNILVAADLETVIDFPCFLSGLLLALEADYPYTESETIKIKEVHSNETILPSPPPYQESDPLTPIHFKKFTKKKHSSTPVPTPESAAISSLGHIEYDSPVLRKKSVDLSPISPREIKLSKRHSFLNQVPTPTEIPKLAFDFPSVSTPNLSVGVEPNQSLVKDPQKSSEKKSLLEYFGFKTGSKAESDVVKAKIEKNVVPVVPKSEKKVETVVQKNDKKTELTAPAPISKPIAKQKVKKVRVLKSDKKENARKSETVQNERPADVPTKNIIKSLENTRSEEKTVLVLHQNDLAQSNEKILENRMEIDYFQKVKKSKSNRVPVIVKSPKPEPKFEDKQPKNEVFRHEETFSAANGPLKVKKKKIKSTPQEAIVANGTKSAEITNKDVNQNSSTSFSKSSEAAAPIPIPKPRAILKLDGFDNDNRDTEIKPKKKVVLPVLSSPSSPSDTEDAWNMVAKHRLNTRAITATAISVRQKSESDDAKPLSLQGKQLEMLNKPKTMREMKREQDERQEKVLNFGGKDDKESDTEA